MTANQLIKLARRALSLLLSFLASSFATLASRAFQYIRFTENTHESDEFFFCDFVVLDAKLAKEHSNLGFPAIVDKYPIRKLFPVI